MLVEGRFVLTVTIVEAALVLLASLHARPRVDSPVALRIILLADVFCSQSRLRFSGSAGSLTANCSLLRVSLKVRFDAPRIESIA